MPKKLSEITGVAPPPPEVAPSEQLANSDIYLGIEVELENVEYGRVYRRVASKSLLTVEEDGSLRGGVEIKTTPVRGSNLIKAMQQLDEVLSGYSPECTERTGLHIHVDMRDADTKQLINLVTTCLIFEGSLFKYCGKHREDNPYCVPLREMASEVGGLVGLLSRSPDVVHDTILGHVKYSAINLRPLTNFGTVEFRMHRGTADSTEILQWANVLLSLMSFCLSTNKAPQDIIDSVCIDPEKLFKEVFNSYLHEPTQEDYTYMLDGARIAQEFYRYRPLEDISNSLLTTLYGKEGLKAKKGIPKKATVTGRGNITIDEMMEAPPIFFATPSARVR